MLSPRILVSGAGIAGSVFAHWMLRAYPNADITIVERAPALRLTGASVDIRSSGVDIIKWMGAEQEIRNHSTKEQGIQFVRPNGTVIATFGATGNTNMQSFTSEYEIFRGELAKVFIEPIKSRVKLIFDDFVEKYEQHDDGVTVSFAKSKKVDKFDLLVAADGFYSKIRGQMLNTKPEEQICDEGVHVAYFTIKEDLLQGSRLASWCNMPGGRVIFVRPDPNPAGRTRGNLINVTTSRDTEMKTKLNTALHEGDESYKKLLEQSFHDFGWIAPDVLKGMRESDDFYCSLFAQVRSPKYQDGRVVLLGDAAYATPGIGTSLAITGAYVLAGELLTHPGDFQTAFKNYEQLMLPFVKKQQVQLPNAAQMLNPQTSMGIGIRNAIMGFITLSRLDKLAMNAGAILGFTEKKLTMPDYQWPPA